MDYVLSIRFWAITASSFTGHPVGTVFVYYSRGGVLHCIYIILDVFQRTRVSFHTSIPIVSIIFLVREYAARELGSNPTSIETGASFLDEGRYFRDIRGLSYRVQCRFVGLLRTTQDGNVMRWVDA